MGLQGLLGSRGCEAPRVHSATCFEADFVASADTSAAKIAAAVLASTKPIKMEWSNCPTTNFSKSGVRSQSTEGVVPDRGNRAIDHHRGL